MFRKELVSRFGKIFGLKKVTFDAPSESFEQDTLFIEVQDVRSNVGHGTMAAKVTGSIVAFSQKDKLPYGYFAQRIAQAAPELVADLFFHDLDREALGSAARMQNIAERRASFVFLFSAQYDPNQDEIEEFEISEGS